MATNANLNVDVKVKGKQQLDGLNRSLGNLGSAAKLAVGALAVVGTAKLVKGFVNVGKEVENLQLRFKFLFGSAEEGAKAFETLNKFAATVPFSLDEIQAASGNLAVVSKDAGALGKNLQLTANIAAVSGLSFQQTGEQLQRALAGGIASADIFRERGVTALLGFEQGAKVSIEETRKRLIELFGAGGEFGNAADEMANTLTGTLSMISDSFRKFQEATASGFFEELKTQFGDLDTFLKENEKEIANYGKALGGVLARSISATGSAVKFLADNVILLKVAFGGLGIIMVANSFIKLANTLKIMVPVIKALTMTMLKNPLFLAIAVGAGGALYLFREQIQGLIDDFVDVDEEITQLNEITNTYEDSIIRVARAMETNKNNIVESTKATNENTEATRKSKEMMDSHVGAFEEARTMFKRYTDSLGQLGETDLERFTRQRDERLAKLDKQYSESLGMTKEYEQAKQNIEDEFARQREVLRQKETQAELQASRDRIAKFKDVNRRMGDNEKLTQEEMGEVVRDQAGKTMDALATQNKKFFQIQKAAKIAAAIQDTAAGVMRGFAQGGILGFLYAGMIAAMGAAQISAIRSQSYPGRDKGGTVVGNQPYMVGESGPELVIPGRTGTVVPNDKLGGSGNVVNVNFTINAIDTSDFNDMLVDRRDMIIGMINQALAERGQRSLLA